MRGLTERNGTLELSNDLEPPVAGPGEVLVRVRGAGMNPYDLESLAGRYDFYFRLYGARQRVRTGLEFAGVVETDGERFRRGDRVFGYVHMIAGQKTHQQRIAVSEDYMARMPDGLDFAEAAALPLGALTALVALREKGRLGPGQRVLINGATGGVGIYAVQIARMLEGRVTAVAGPGQEDFLRELGADRVIDYTERNIADEHERYDLLLDWTARLRLGDVRGLLAPGGRFVPADPIANLGDFPRAWFGSHRADLHLISMSSGKFVCLSSLPPSLPSLPSLLPSPPASLPLSRPC